MTIGYLVKRCMSLGMERKTWWSHKHGQDMFHWNQLSSRMEVCAVSERVVGVVTRCTIMEGRYMNTLEEYLFWIHRYITW